MSRDPQKSLLVDVVIPAQDAETTIGAVVAAVPSRLVRAVVVVDAGSADRTAQAAEDAGAVVVRESRRGSGAACLRGVAHVAALPRPPDVVVFLPGDGSFDPGELPALVAPLRESLFDLVIGSRALGEENLAPRLRVRNFVAVELIRAIYGHRYTDLGPFRAIRFPALVALGLSDAGHGWWVEMQVKALKVGLRIAEVPVRFRPPEERPTSLGAQIRGTLGASGKALFQIFRHSTAR